MPDFPIVDSHVHLWDPAKYRIPWLDGIPALNRPLHLQEFDAATAGIDVEAIVYLEIDVAPPYQLIEARDVAALGDHDPRVQGVVAAAALEYGAQLRCYLEELVKLGPRIKGVRRLTQNEPDPDYCLQPSFIAGTRLLSEFGLSCDFCCTHRQFAQTVELARRVPETQFILDHIGKPDIQGGKLEPWATQMRDLASLPNVFCKISGVVTEADHGSWTAEQIKPYVLHALDAFGEDRVVFGSDWSVVTLATTYATWVETLETLTHDLPDAAKRKLWSGNAKRFYRL